MTKKSTQAAILLIFILLSGCAGASLKDYDPGESLQDQFERDGAACEMAAEGHKSSGGYGGMTALANLHASYDKMYDACMRSKGYKKK